MKPTPTQQILAGLAVFFVVAVTLAGGLLLALSDNPGGLGVSRPPTSTPFRLPTLAPTTIGDASALTPDEAAEVASPTPIVVQPMETKAQPATVTATNVPPTSRPTATAATCQIRSGWVPYAVRSGDTLFKIGLAVGRTIDELQAGNCLRTSALEVGQTLYLPSLPPREPQPSATPANTLAPTAGPTPTNSDTDGSCSNVYSNITSPQVGAVIGGVVNFYGTATHEDFSFYKLEFREYNTGRDQFVTFVTEYQPVSGGLLGVLDTTLIPNGMYWIRVVVVDSIGNWPEPCSKLYRITN